MLKNNSGLKNKSALDKLFYDVMEEKESCRVKRDSNIINTFDVDVLENDMMFIVEAELPGFTIDNISIVYEEDYLSISAQRKECHEGKNDSYIRRERRFGAFRRNFYVENVDRDQIRATLKNGVLKVELPKMIGRMF